jgi:curli biogenesis system outer membrane secretion channel CsgG
MRWISVFLALNLLLSPLTASLAVAQSQTRASVAVMDMEPKGVPENEVSALSDRLRTELFRTGAFDVMERGKMQDVLKEQGFQQSGACNTDACAVEIGQMIGVQKMIGGSLGKVGKTYTVNLRMIDVKTGRIERSVTEDYTGEIDKLLTSVMRTVAYTLSQTVQQEAPKGAKQDKKPAAQAMPKPAAEGKPLYKKWWFWGGIGLLGAGGAAAALAGGGSSSTGGETPVDYTIPAPPPRP